ncbi:MAG: aspartate aminotransferase family protein [Candidatus Microthrix sp.]|nr:pyridoxal-dependent decarboxylase [Candidatus Microthrix sp.]MBK6438919.1 aspartate aminotransferase family protein [Candidatus Microthrix sp.]
MTEAHTDTDHAATDETDPDATNTDVGTFPAVGTAVDQLLDTMRTERADDLDWRGGKAFSLVYNADDPELERLQHDVAEMFLHENALNPFRYRTLLHMEGDIVAWASNLFGAPEGAGSISSGGTESIFLAVQVARDEARARGNLTPTILTPETAHPAFAKACSYLDVERISIPLRADLRADPAAFAAALDERTIMLVGSSPCYPYGLIDPIPEIAGIAAQAGILCHVDACLGGWLLPFWASIGRKVPPFDLTVPGVTSLSADIHKYGYAYKGASVILYSSPEYVDRQTFMFDDWPGGLYASRTTAGTRPGGPIAGAWATIAHLGRDGYERQARRVAAATDGFRAAVDAVDGLQVTGDPDMSVFEISTPEGSGVDLEGVSDEMDARDWALDRQQGGLHVMLSPGHDRVIDEFAADLAASVAAGRTGAGAEAVYGSVV